MPEFTGAIWLEDGTLLASPVGGDYWESTVPVRAFDGLVRSGLDRPRAPVPDVGSGVTLRIDGLGYFRAVVVHLGIGPRSGPFLEFRSLTPLLLAE